MTDATQGTAEWMEARRGKVTGSRVKDALTTLKSGKWAQTRENYRIELVAERLTKSTANHYTSKAMEWGNEVEANAIAAYEYLYDTPTQRVGFVEHPTILNFGASPDRLVVEDGLVEAKALISRHHVELLLTGEIPDEYLWQVWAELSCTGREWCDWIAFDPRMPPEMQMFKRRVTRDDEAIRAMEAGVVEFIGEVEDTVGALWRAVGRDGSAAA